MSIIYKEVIILIWFTFYVRCFTKCIWSVAAWMIFPTQTRTRQEECTGQALAGGLGVGRVVRTPVPTANGVLPDSTPRSGSGRSGSMQSSSSFPLNKDSGQGLSQLTNRKARSSKQQQQQGSGLLEDLRAQDPHSPTAQGPTVQRNMITTDSWQPWIKTSTGLSLLSLTCLQNTIHNSLHKTKVMYNNISA